MEDYETANDQRKVGAFGSINGSIGAGMLRGGTAQTQTANAPQTSTPVTGRLEEMARGVEALHQSIGMLEERLAMALAPSAPNAQVGEKDRVDSTQLGVILTELSGRIRSATYRVNDIMQRVEL